MELEVIKRAGIAFEKCKTMAEVNKPQLTAAAGTGCFIGGVIFATKETPEANDAVEKKRVNNPDMTKLEELAVKIPYYTKTIGFTAAGLGLTFLAWKFEAMKVAAMATMCAELANENSSLREAIHEIVDPKTENEIVRKAEENKNAPGIYPDDYIPPEHRIVPIKLSLTGKVLIDTKAQQENKLEKVIDVLCENGEIAISTLFEICEWGYCDLCEKDYYYTCIQHNRKDAKDALDYCFVPDEDEYGRLGYTLQLSPYQGDR